MIYSLMLVSEDKCREELWKFQNFISHSQISTLRNKILAPQIA